MRGGTPQQSSETGISQKRRLLRREKRLAMTGGGKRLAVTSTEGLVMTSVRTTQNKNYDQTKIKYKLTATAK